MTEFEQEHIGSVSVGAPEPISRDLLGKIVDEVFDGAIEDAFVIEAIYAAIKKHDTPPPQDHWETREGCVGEMTPDRAVYFLERFKREEKMLGPHEQWALDFAISALSEPVNVRQLGGKPEDLRNTLCAVIELFGMDGAQKVTEYALSHRGTNAFDGSPAPAQMAGGAA